MIKLPDPSWDRWLQVHTYSFLNSVLGTSRADVEHRREDREEPSKHNEVTAQHIELPCFLPCRGVFFRWSLSFPLVFAFVVLRIRCDTAICGTQSSL